VGVAADDAEGRKKLAGYMPTGVDRVLRPAIPVLALLRNESKGIG